MARNALVFILRNDPALARVEMLAIRRDPDRGWTVTISYAGMSRVNPHELGQAHPIGAGHAVSIDMDAVPDGVAVHATSKDADRVVGLPDLDGDIRAAVETMVGALAESGLMGSPLDEERHDPASVDAMAHDPWPRWYIRPGPHHG